MRRLQILDLGIIPYEEAHRLQHELVRKRLEDAIPDTLLLLEHPHVITLGRRMKGVELKVEGVPVYEVERGGEATYHGPGQLVGYLIVDLNSAQMSIKSFVWLIEEALIKALKEFGVDGERMENHPGVWVKGKKIASIGLALRWWITYHGFALNVNTDLRYFRLIKPCGLDPEVMTSMEKILGETIEMSRVKKVVAEKLVEVFHYQPLQTFQL